MLTLNLISLEQKKEIKLRHIYNFIKNINLILIFTALIVAIIFLIARMIILSNIGEIMNKMSLLSKSTRGYNNSIIEINNEINFINKIQGEFIPWSVFIKNLAVMASADVSFYYLKLNSQDKTIKIKGQAAFRGGLLDLKEKMQASAYFYEIDFPLKNILEKESIDFEINAKLRLNKI